MSPYIAFARAFAGSILVASLVAGCAGFTRDSRMLDVDGLHNAILADNVEYVQGLIMSRSASVNEPIPAPGYPQGTPLITIAARSASLEVMRYLISAGADVNARTPAGETALMLASFFFKEDRERDALSYEQHEAAVRMLVEAGADIENDPHHYTPLAYAAYQGRDRTVRFLLERGARVDADTQDGMTYINTPLMMAAIQGHHITALWLLLAGADPRIRVHQGHTAAEFAQKYNHSNLFRMLKCAESLAPGEAFAAKCE
ncbi:MAG: hypothetical protein A3G24_01810 [Betaproteobacteria bacterium RIFCSPLOWO2_12_FULL_62_13]|nr:MAG: hypothetical protein A3G24_01810 [Betaproteobacteria bacterium RIFCSPLOWO2_12_FULL_62_13]